MNKGMSRGLWRTLCFSALAMLVIAGMALGLTSTSASVVAQRANPGGSDLAPLGDGVAEAMIGGDASKPLHIMVEMSGLPATLAYAQAATITRGAVTASVVQAAKQQKSANQQEQQTALQALSSIQPAVTVMYQVQSAYNGIAMIADRKAIAQIQKIAGVKAIRLITPQKLENASSVPLIGAPAAWTSGNLTGQGVKIGVIDTGIDYTHTNFGGPGSGYGTIYTDTTPLSAPQMAGVFPSVKVAGGYDLAGDSYNADPTDPAYQPIPNPDPNPLDCNGHGSHVAGTATGYGVNADGTTYTGPYNNSTPFGSLRIGPGVAPNAKLYSFRVFGCAGSTDLVTQAVDMAVDPNSDGDFSDRMDVINLSLGSSYGTPDSSDAVAINNAAQVGVASAISAGNAGDVYYVLGSPGSATRALTVAASADDTDITDGFRENSPNPAVYPGSKSSAYDYSKPPVTATLYYPSAANQYGCSPWTGADLTNISGTIVLVDWRKASDTTFPCGSATRANNATAAGAKGIIMADKTTYLDTAILGNSSIPAYYTVKQVGDSLKAQLTAGTLSNVSITLGDPQYFNSIKIVSPGENNTLASFSSRGPRTRDSALKPDISAPGLGTFSTANGTGNQGESLSGTSMASPHIAGTLVLLRQLHPTWSVEELKALAMNTADVDIYTGFNQTGDKYGPGRVGAGRVDITSSLASNVVAYNTDVQGAVSVSFGEIEVLGTAALTRTITVSNKGTGAVTYNVGLDQRTTVPGVAYSFPDGNSVTLAANTSTTIRVRLDATASAMKHTRDVTVAGTQSGLPRHWISEASGLVTFTPVIPVQAGITSGPPLRVPVYAVLRPASAMTTAQTSLNFPGPSGVATLNLVGQGVQTGSAFPTDTVSLVTPMELAATSDPIVLSPPDPTSSARDADLKYVGITSDVKGRLNAGQPITSTRVFFGISTYGEWSAPASEVEFDVYIDANRDGTADYVLYNTRLVSGTDVFVTTLLNLKTGSSVTKDFTNGIPATLDTAIFNNDVLMMPLRASDIYTNAANTRFNYQIFTFSNASANQVDESPLLTYDYANPGLDFSGGFTGVPTYFDLPGGTIPVNYNRAAFDANGSKAALLFHYFNTRGNRAQVLPVGPLSTVTTTSTSTGTSTTTSTTVPSSTSTTVPSSTSTSTAVPSGTAVPSVTPTVCRIQFQDVPPSSDVSSFYPFVQCLACRGVLGGYPCGGTNNQTGQAEPCGSTGNPYFRPSNNITRAQIAKIVSNAAGFNNAVTGQTYADVPPSNDVSSFYVFIERLSQRNVMGGYPCDPTPGATFEPCDGQNRAYFRPSNSATRGQLAKIVSNAAGFVENVSGQTFADVPPSTSPSSFYLYVERLSSRGVIGGYPCGTSNPNSGPCDAQNRPYFRPGNVVSRAQAAKIVANTFFPNCQNRPTPSPTAAGTSTVASTSVATTTGTTTAVPIGSPTGVTTTTVP